VPIQDAPLPVQGQDDNASVAQKAQDKSNQLIRAALVEWIGSKTQAAPPRDVVAWVVDKDLIQPAVSSLEVRLLVNKRQLDSMRTVLGEVMAAGIKGQVDGDQFFSALQATSTLVARAPDQIKNAQKMAETGLIPEFLMNLPYHSRLMEMNNDLWASWSVDEQDEFLNEMNAKIEAYESIHDRPDGWIALNRGDDPDDHVYPISLELLP
jgi:serine/threonine-protein kinase PpkA